MVLVKVLLKSLTDLNSKWDELDVIYVNVLELFIYLLEVSFGMVKMGLGWM